MMTATMSTPSGAGTPSSSNALTRRGADGVLSSSSSSLGVYGPSHSTLRQKVLSEEAYTSTLSRLIQRDFFPHLEKLEAENAYLDALTKLDDPDGEARLERAVRRLVGQEVRAGIVPPSPRSLRGGGRNQYPTTIEDTPVQRETQWDPTPVAGAPHDDDSGSDREEQPAEEQAPSLDGLTLSAFQAAYTSEDNASFLQLLEAGQQSKKEAFRWAYKAEAMANERRRLALRAANLEAQAGFEASVENAPPDVRMRIEGQREAKLITASGEGASSEQPVTASPLNEIGLAAPKTTDDGVHGTPRWTHKARNALFYGPDADRSTIRNRTSSLAWRSKRDWGESASSLYEGDNVPDAISSHRASGINFTNTRLYDENDSPEDGRIAGSETPQSSRIDAAIGGRLLGPPSSDDGMSQRNDLEGATRYDFVSPLPSPRPGDLGEERVRQLMTWGTIMGTPRAVDQQQSTSSDDEQDDASAKDGSFRLPPTPRRDTLARQLTDKVGSGRRKHALGASRNATASPSSTKRTRADLSPAARTLLDRASHRTTLGNALLGAKKNEEKSADRLRRQRWTPSPSPQRGAG